MLVNLLFGQIDNFANAKVALFLHPVRYLLLKKEKIMFKLKDVGDYETLPQIAIDIINGNVDALEEHAKNGWNVNSKIFLSEDIDDFELPINLALIMESFASVRWLVAKGVNLNSKNNPIFLKAVRYCNKDIIMFLVEHGAKINNRNNVKSEAFQQALYGNRYDNLPLIHELGHTVEKYGGEAFRAAVSDENYRALEFFIKHNVDINYNKSDMVYSFKPTPLCVAARYVDLKMCKYLVEHGADVTLAEKDGMRPYSIAIEKGDRKMAEYFKRLEPVEFHNLKNKLDELKPYKLPKNLISFLQSENLHVACPESSFEYVDFFSLTETIPFTIGRKKLLRLSKNTGDYSDIVLVWNPKTKKIGYYDLEHEELVDLCTFEEFLQNPSVELEKMFK